MCQVNRRGFTGMLLDNDEVFLSYISAVVDSVDEYANLEVVKSPYDYKFRIATSLPKYNSLLMEELLKFYNMFHIKISMGKSIKTSGTITFNIEINQ